MNECNNLVAHTTEKVLLSGSRVVLFHLIEYPAPVADRCFLIRIDFVMLMEIKASNSLCGYSGIDQEWSVRLQND